MHLEVGLRVLDSSAGGLGGCPFAPGAAGNVAIEAVLDHLEALAMRRAWTGRRLRRLLVSPARLSSGFPHGIPAWELSAFMGVRPESQLSRRSLAPFPHDAAFVHI